MTDPFEFSDEAFESVPPAQQAAPDYLSGLNPEQRMAVEVTDGPVLVLAGAGTGKTRVLTTRLAHIMDCGLAYAGEIMAVTFTNKAALEMKERVAGILGRPVEGWWLGTFHALAARILRAHAEVVGLTSNFTIVDTDDQLRLLKQIMEAERVDEKKNPARNLMGVIQRWKDRALTPDKVSPSEGAAFADGAAIKIYQIYQERLRLNNACDFGDLLMHVLTIFSEQPQILEQYQRRFRYILVDEYQDTNISQYLWLRLLAKEHRNICCVGDDDQSIYSWRGAEVANILKFEKDFPGATVVRLERNYRSTSHILGAASGLIAYNEDRLGKTLQPQRTDEAIKVRVESHWDGESEARFVGDEIESLQRKGESLNEIAILVRAGFQTREFEERMITLAIPYKVVGGLRFYEREEIRDAIAYLRVINQPHDSLALERIINKPSRGFGPKTKGLQSLLHYSRTAQVSLYSAAVTLVDTDELSPKAKLGLRELLDQFDLWRSLKDGLDVDELVGQVLDESGYMDMRQAEAEKGKDVKAQGRIDNLKELISGLKEFDSLAEFLEHVSLVMEVQDRDDEAKVTIMTLHAAKGLEFDNVFLPGWEEGTFPNQRALDEAGNRALEEERRLGYVGITRARKRSIISYALRRRVFGQYNDMLPSRFVDELPDIHIEKGGETGSSHGGNAHGGFSGFGEPNQQRFTYRGSRESRPEKLITIDAYDVKVSDAPDNGYRKGDHVRHGKFGNGVVLAVDGNKLEIAFAQGGRKKVIDSFVEKI